MAGGSLYQDEDAGAAISDINVTPLVDVVLVLLIIFMVTAKLIVAQGVELTLPKSSVASEVKSTMRVDIDAQRVLHINGDPYQDAEKARLRIEGMLRADPELKAIIAADTTVPYGELMRAVEIVKTAGVNKLAFATEGRRGTAASPGASDTEPAAQPATAPPAETSGQDN